MFRSLASVVLTPLVIAACLMAAHSSTAAERVRHTVTVDGHPIALHEKSAPDAEEAILLVHGRTWSALPDFDLQVPGEELSLMEGLVDAGYAVFAVDLRGYGDTPRDSTGWLSPTKAAADVIATLQWIDSRQAWRGKPHLFGWSMGSTISHLAAQSEPGELGSLTLFGFWHDLDQTLPPDPESFAQVRLTNSAEAAASDFITPGSISQKAIDTYVAAALAADPVKTDIRNVSDYNGLNPGLLTMPTLVMVGEHDPIAPLDRQTKLFSRVGTGHKQLVVVPNGDHAAFLETPRDYFLEELVTFLKGAQ